MRASVLPLQHRHLSYTVAQVLAEFDMPVVVAAEVENVVEAERIVVEVAEQMVEGVLEEAARVSGMWELALEEDVLSTRDEVVVLVVGLIVYCKSLGHWERSWSHLRLFRQLWASWELGSPR